jgi:hypothetical protein
MVRRGSDQRLSGQRLAVNENIFCAYEKGQIKRRAEVQHSLLASGGTFAVCSADPTTTA